MPRLAASDALLPACLRTLQDLVDLAKPGDRITVTGVYRAMGVRTNPRLRELKVLTSLPWATPAHLPAGVVVEACISNASAAFDRVRDSGGRGCAQSVYKTYIDVVHIQKDEASNLFSMFAAEESQTQLATQVGLSQDPGERTLADAANTQAAGAMHTSNMTREEMEAKRVAFQVWAAPALLVPRSTGAAGR